MIPIFKTTNKILKLSIQCLYIIQIILILLILLTASYWFFDLIGINFLKFVQPLAIKISKFIHTFYHQQVEIGGQYFDGSLLLFDLISIALIVVSNKVKQYMEILIDDNIKRIKIRENHIEEQFNKKLKKEAEVKVSKLKNIAILVEFDFKNCNVDNFWGGDKNNGVKEKTEEAFNEFHTALKSVVDCKIAKTDNKMLILNDNFENIEKILDIINKSIYEIRFKSKKKRWIMNFYASIDLYENDSQIKEIYPTLQSLIDLKIQNEMLSMGNFSIRYDMLISQTYDIVKKGHYDLKDNSDVSIWSIIKKF